MNDSQLILHSRARGAFAIALAIGSLSIGACNAINSSSGDDTGGNPDGGGSGSGLLPGMDERVTGIFCTAPDACVISTQCQAGVGCPGHVYASDGHTITATLVTGDETLAAKEGVDGTLDFFGFSRVGDRLIARADSAEAFISATGDFTKPASWTTDLVGTTGGVGFGLNEQEGLGSTGATWTLAVQGIVFASSGAPGANTTWTEIWTPLASPPVPEDIEDLRAADPTLCDSDPGVSSSVPLVQSIYVASDLSIVVSPSGALNQDSNDSPGVCISTDGGHRFHHVAFAGLEATAYGPMGVACTSKDHCVAYGDDAAGPVNVYTSSNASMGSASTWTRASGPTIADDSKLRTAFFAPDGTHGWLVGTQGAAGGLLLATSDGGATWTDESGKVAAKVGSNRLHTGFTADGIHLWLGGEHDTLFQISE